MVNAEERDEMLADLVTVRALDPRAARPAAVSDDDWAEAGRLARVELALQFAIVQRSSEAAPPLAQDKTAAMLGLVPEPHLRMDGRTVARRRKAVHLNVDGLAARLAEQGWPVSTADVFRWETQSTDDVPPALLTAVAQVLSTTMEALAAPPSAGPGLAGLDEASKQPRFQALVGRFARLQRQSTVLAESSLRSVALATVRRGETPDSDVWIDVLEAYVSALEQRHDT